VCECDFLCASVHVNVCVKNVSVRVSVLYVCKRKNVCVSACLLCVCKCV